MNLMEIISNNHKIRQHAELRRSIKAMRISQFKLAESRKEYQRVTGKSPYNLMEVENEL
jgi:hypothetical protein